MWIRAARHVSVVRFGSLNSIFGAENCGNGLKIRIPDQSIQVLAILLEHSGEVVTRGELYESFWPNGTIVEFEHGVNSVINRLRLALEDFPHEPQFIETLRGGATASSFLLSSRRPLARTDPLLCCPLRT